MANGVAPKTRDLLHSLLETGPLTTKELVNKSGLSPHHVLRGMRLLVRNGLVESTKRQRVQDRESGDVYDINVSDRKRGESLIKHLPTIFEMRASVDES